MHLFTSGCLAHVWYFNPYSRTDLPRVSKPKGLPRVSKPRVYPRGWSILQVNPLFISFSWLMTYNVVKFESNPKNIHQPQPQILKASLLVHHHPFRAHIYPVSIYTIQIHSVSQISEGFWFWKLTYTWFGSCGFQILQRLAAMVMTCDQISSW